MNCFWRHNYMWNETVSQVILESCCKNLRRCQVCAFSGMLYRWVSDSDRHCWYYYFRKRTAILGTGFTWIIVLSRKQIPAVQAKKPSCCSFDSFNILVTFWSNKSTMIALEIIVVIASCTIWIPQEHTFGDSSILARDLLPSADPVPGPSRIKSARMDLLNNPLPCCCRR